MALHDLGILQQDLPDLEPRDVDAAGFDHLLQPVAKSVPPVLLGRGTDGSNPFPSNGESTANSTSGQIAGAVYDQTGHGLCVDVRLWPTGRHHHYTTFGPVAGVAVQISPTRHTFRIPHPIHFVDISFFLLLSLSVLLV
jgi:hypothetical protein